MKKLLVIAVLTVFAQTTKSQLIYDFNKAQFTKGVNTENGKVIPIKSSGFATLKIININTFRYKVELEGNSVNYITPIPSELQTIFRLSSDSYNDENLIKALNLTSDAAKSMQQKSDVAKVVAEQESDKAENIVNSGAADPTKVAAQAKSAAADDLNNAMGKLAIACEQYVQIARKVANIKFTEMQLINVSKQQWKDHNELLASMPQVLSQSQMKKDYDIFVDYYAKAEALYSSAKLAAEKAKGEKVEDAAATLKAIVEAEEKIDKGRDLFYEDNFIKLIQDVVVLQQALEKPEYFKVQSAPIQVDGDFVAFKLKITPAQVNDLMPYEISREFPVEIPVKGGLKVDFSVGPAISFGDNSKDEVFYLENTTKTDTVQLKQRNNNNAISPGIAAMMHFGPRTGKDWRVAGMFGVGAGFQGVEDVKLSIYGGLSAVFGKRERIMLSTGVSYLRVSRLKDAEYVVNKEYASSLISIGQASEKVFKPSFFISLSYNLSNRLEIK